MFGICFILDLNYSLVFIVKDTLRVGRIILALLSVCFTDFFLNSTCWLEFFSSIMVTLAVVHNDNCRSKPPYAACNIFISTGKVRTSRVTVTL